MVGKLIAGILSLSLVFASPVTFAANKNQDKTAQSTTQGPRKHLTTIVMAGLAGAILGLSTLSFYGRPQDKLSNIAAGFAIGIIIGAGYTTYKAATEPKEFMGWQEANPDGWKLASETQFAPQRNSVPRTEFVFHF